MKIFRKSAVVLAACICMAALCAPLAFAAGQGTGSMQGGPGGQGTMNQMQAPPSGDQGGENGGEAGGNGNRMQAPSSGGTGGNMTMGQPPEGLMGNMTRSGGHGGMGGNMTMGQPPEGIAGNMTMFGGREGIDGNMTMFGPRGGMDGNMTMGQPPEGMTGNMTAPPDRTGNTTMMNPGRGGMAFGNMTPPSGVPGDGQADGSGTLAADVPSKNPGQQQSKDDMIADLISKLQSLLSGGK